MKRNETKMILAVLVVAFPMFYRNKSEADTEAAVNLWQMQFQDYDYKTVEQAVQALISTKVEGYPPTIGEVKEYIRKLNSTDEIDESAAWAMVSKATRNSSYYSEREFAKLPPLVQKAVGSAEQLRQWAGMDADDVETVIQSHFRKAYRAEVERAAQIEKLPSQIRNYIGGYADNFKMIGD